MSEIIPLIGTIPCLLVVVNYYQKLSNKIGGGEQ